jgi:hypothetical protein
MEEQDPKDWSVKNGCFIGYVLVEVEQEQQPGKMKPAPKEGWLPGGQDLRVVDNIKHNGPKHPERTSLYVSGNFVCAVNVAVHSLMPHWLAVRHCFDRQLCKDVSFQLDTEPRS